MDKRTLLKNELLALKKHGFQVFINKQTALNPNSHYGLIYNGKDIVYVQYETLGTRFCMSFNYQASSSHGRACLYHNLYNGVEHITIDEINKVIEYGHGYVIQHKLQLYRNINEYFDYLRTSDMYEKL